MTDKISAIQGLVSLGLSLGESKVYTALYTSGTLEATPLATIAEVPQSKVYSYL
ncbi:MAG: TrmB family transcriptional regulator, partial [Candidatus Heimdallarchaeota archaeon]|nr:TrmB family transcriptional regulator [Candidatus Heimdallarchaeota archaeon]